MLVKCVCPHCGHSFLADDQGGRLQCTRCHSPLDGSRNASDIEDPPRGTEGYFEPMMAPHTGPARRFDPLAAPPMYVTRERFTRGLVFGGLAAALLGGAIGGAFTAVGVAVPVVTGLLVGLVAGGVCRYGFGGRSVAQTRGRAALGAGLAAMAGVSGFIAGAWALERQIAARAEVVRADLDEGLEALVRRRDASSDEGQRILVEQSIIEVERLRRRPDAGLEDYLWVQEAQIAQPLLAYGKLRALNGPVVKLGPEREPIAMPAPANAALLGLELVVALVLAVRGVQQK